MPEVNQAALDFLLTRRSRPAKTLSSAAPSTADLNLMLTAAARTPDHGKLEPFRFIVIRGEARSRLSEALASHMRTDGETPDNIEKHAGRLLHGGAIVVVVFSPRPPKKVPEHEQHLSAGGACLALLNAALAMGWGANWLTGAAAECRPFLETDLGLAPHESVAGFIHIGGETITPADRPRPDIAAITSWIGS
ncbi:nitroreductase family protein [Pikeienuella sp. HZG-20]|uniref:nitroreductase family protein n=1 Tax=Paludibacillus litoralis TaxID=3133267 RepID=UPI0030EE3C40